MTLTASDVLALFQKSGIASIDTSTLLPDISLKEQGLDSLDLMTFFLEVEDTYHIQVPDEDYERLVTADEIAAYLNERLAA